MEIPQADRLEQVLKVVEAVKQGKQNDEEIENFIGVSAPIATSDSKKRQGRYYRKAAELLGFIKNTDNVAQLTEKGYLFCENPTIQNILVTESIMSIPVFEKIIAFTIKNSQIDRAQLKSILKTNGKQDTTVNRRINSVTGWLKTADLMIQEGQYYKINIKNLPFVDHILQDENTKNIFEAIDIKEKVYEYTNKEISDLEVDENRYSSFCKDDAKLEKANNSHRKMLNLFASTLKQKHISSFENKIIDLYFEHDRSQYILEAKSATENFRNQVRKGIVQLYEYRFKFKRQAKLILFVGKEFPDNLQWMFDFVETDLKIMLVWLKNGAICCNENTKKSLSFLFSDVNNNPCN